jgi:hypothetical protein
MSMWVAISDGLNEVRSISYTMNEFNNPQADTGFGRSRFSLHLLRFPSEVYAKFA